MTLDLPLTCPTELAPKGQVKLVLWSYSDSAQLTAMQAEAIHPLRVVMLDSSLTPYRPDLGEFPLKVTEVIAYPEHPPDLVITLPEPWARHIQDMLEQSDWRSTTGLRARLHAEFL